MMDRRFVEQALAIAAVALGNRGLRMARRGAQIMVGSDPAHDRKIARQRQAHAEALAGRPWRYPRRRRSA